MPTSLFPDLALARRLEQAYGGMLERFATTCAAAHPELRTGALPVGGGQAVYAGPAFGGLTNAVGLGLHGPVTPADLDRLESFYRERNCEPIVSVCPFADRSLLDLVMERGYTLLSPYSVLYRTLTPGGATNESSAAYEGSATVGGTADEAGAPCVAGTTYEGSTTAGGTASLERDTSPERDPSRERDAAMESGASTRTENELTIEQVTEANTAEWSETVIRGFLAREDAEPTVYEPLKARSRDTICYLARIGGQPAGAAAMTIVGDAAYFWSASTVPTFRRRGVQAALLRARLKDAAAAGCDLAVLGTEVGNTSQRNAQRSGFQVAYTVVDFVLKTG